MQTTKSYLVLYLNFSNIDLNLTRFLNNLRIQTDHINNVIHITKLLLIKIFQNLNNFNSLSKLYLPTLIITRFNKDTLSDN